MTNRLGRAIDRARILHREFRSGDAAEQPRIQTQLQILWNRATMIRLAVIMASFSMLLALSMTVALFLAALLHWDAGGEIMFMFIGCLLALFLALLLFIHDINQSLAALKVGFQDAFRVRSRSELLAQGISHRPCACARLAFISGICTSS